MIFEPSNNGLKAVLRRFEVQTIQAELLRHGKVVRWNRSQVSLSALKHRQMILGSLNIGPRALLRRQNHEQTIQAEVLEASRNDLFGNFEGGKNSGTVGDSFGSSRSGKNNFTGICEG